MRQLSSASGSLVRIACGDFCFFVVFVHLFTFVFVVIVLSCLHETAKCAPQTEKASIFHVPVEQVNKPLLKSS